MPADKSLEYLSGAVVKIAESYPDVNKHVKEIRDAICGTQGILNAINAISERLDKNHKQEQIRRLAGRQRVSELSNRKLLNNTSSINKTLNKIFGQMKTMSRKGGLASGRMARLNADNFRRNDRDPKLRRLESISMSVNVIERLRGLKLRDFIFAKKKLKNINKILFGDKKLKGFLNMFRKFKNQDEVDGTLNFANSSIELIKKLGKISILSKPAQWGAKAIEKIFIGKTGKGGLLKLFRTITKHKVEINIGTRTMKQIVKACGSMLLSSIALTSIAVLSIPAMLGALAMKGIVFLLVGTFKTLEKSRRPVIKGSAVMLIMSASIITFALGMGLMVKAVKGMKLKDIGMMIASLAGMGLTVAGIGLLSVPIAIGSATLLLMGASLGIFGLALKAWRGIDASACLDNIKTAVGGLREVFGLELGQNPYTDKNDKGKTKLHLLERAGGGILNLAMGILNFGSTFFIMGSILMAGAALGLLYKGLKNWDNFDGKKAAGNIRVAFGALKEVFGIGETKEGLGSKLGKLLGGPLDIGISLLQGGKALAEMAILTIATGLVDMVRLFLKPWNDYNAEGAAKNIGIAFTSLKEAFGIGYSKDIEAPKGNTLKGAGTNLLDLASAIFQSGKTLAQMGTIMLATAMLDIVKLNLKPWEDYNGEKAMGNIRFAVDNLLEVFGLGKINRDEQKATEGTTLWDKIGNGLKKIGGLASDVFGVAGSLVDTASELAKGGNVMTKLTNAMLASSTMFSIKGSLEVWDNFNASSALSNISNALVGIDNLFSDIVNIRSKEPGGLKLSNALYFETATASIKTGIYNLAASWKKSEVFKSSEVPFKKTVENINSIDISKAQIMIDMFKSFSGIKKKPFDKFTESVNKFAESSSDLIDALNNFSNNYNITGTVESGEEGEPTIKQTEGVNINNPQVLAEAIASAIKALPINIENSISDIKLVVDGNSGRRVVLTLED